MKDLFYFMSLVKTQRNYTGVQNLDVSYDMQDSRWWSLTKLLRHVANLVSNTGTVDVRAWASILLINIICRLFISYLEAWHLATSTDPLDDSDGEDMDHHSRLDYSMFIVQESNPLLLLNTTCSSSSPKYHRKDTQTTGHAALRDIADRTYTLEALFQICNPFDRKERTMYKCI